MINDELQVSPPVTCESIDRVHRTGKRSKEKVRPILVKFTSYGVRDQVIRSRKKLKPADSNIKQTLFINEDLTKQRADLLYRARQLKKDKAIQDCWSWDGRILIKNNIAKIIQIRSTNDLMAEMNKLPEREQVVG